MLNRLHNFHRSDVHTLDSLSRDDFHNHYIGKVITRYARAGRSSHSSTRRPSG